MLAYILALAVGLGSLALYLAAFFFPEVYRKGDLIWSGVGLFYALVLWVCAGRITGGVLLGQMASVALLGWFGWQTLKLRRELAPPDQQTDPANLKLPDANQLQEAVSRTLQGDLSSFSQQANRQLANAKEWVQATLTTAKPKTTPSPSATGAPTTAPPTPPVVAATPEAETIVAPEPPGVEPSEPALEGTEPPVEAIAPPAKVSATAPATPAVSPVERAKAVVETLTDLAKSTLASFNKPKVDKPIYVRKQFRKEETDAAPEATTPAPEPSAPAAIPTVEAVDDDFDFSDVESSTPAIEPEVIDPDFDFSDVESSEAISDDSAPLADAVIEAEIKFEAHHETELEAPPAAETEISHPEPVHPNPPPPDLVEAAIEDAEAKHIPAHPPETAEAPNQPPPEDQ